MMNALDHTAREFVPKAGLYYYRARYYDPATGRFLSEDPLQFSAGTHFYAYALSNPVNFLDPTGLRTCCPAEAEQEIRERIQKVREILQRLERTGSAVNTNAGARSPNPLAATGCFRRFIRNGPELPPEARTINYVNPDEKPCLFKCVEAHEAVHRRMRVRVGARVYNDVLNEKQKEMPAYTMELGCHLHLLQSAGLSLLF
jgi:RHS repeat-associated protein